MSAEPSSLPSVARQRLILIVAVLLVTLPSIANRELMPTDEPRFALVARQMVEDPAPIVPHLGYDPLTHAPDLYADKPPLFFWLIALASFATGGVGELAARLPSVLAAIAAALLIRRLGTLLIDARTGFAAALVFLTCNQVFLRAGWCSIDLVLTALVLGATECWLRAAREEPRGRLVVVGSLLGAFATLAKGPLGLLYPLAFLACDRIAARWDVGIAPPGPPATSSPSAPSAPSALRGPSPSSTSRVLILGAIAAAIPLAVWIVAITMIAGSEYTLEILFRQNVTRYVAAWNNIAPWYFYFYRFPVGLLPWTLLLPGALLVWRSVARDRARSLLGLTLTCIAMFVFFSATTGKRGVYLLPLYPAVAILIAASWLCVASRFQRIIGSLHVAAMAVGGASALVLLPRAASRRYPELLGQAWILAAIVVLTALATVVLYLRKRRDGALFAQAFGVLLLVAVGSFLLVPTINARSGLRDFGRSLATLARAEERVVVDQEGFEQILFYAHLPAGRRNFELTRIRIEDDAVLLEPIASKQNAARTIERPIAGLDAPPVRFPPGMRVLFVATKPHADTIRAALGPASRTLMAGTISGETYVVIASRP